MFVVVEVGFLQTRSARVQLLTASSVGNLGRRPPRTTSSRVNRVLGKTGSLLVSSSSRSHSRPPLAGEGKGTQPDPAQPTVAHPKGKGKGQPQDPSSGKGKGKGKEQNKGKPYASRARQDQEAEEAYRRMARARWEAGDVRRSRTTALRGRQRAPQTRTEGSSPSGSRGPPGDNR